MIKVRDAFAWHPAVIPTQERIPELNAGDEILFRISSICLVRHPDLNGLMKIQWTVDYKLKGSHDIYPLAVVNNQGGLETEFTYHTASVNKRDSDIAYWMHQCKRLTVLNVLVGRFSDSSSFNFDVRLQHILGNRGVMQVSSPEVSTTVYRFRSIIHHVCFGLVDNALVPTDSKLICSGEVDDVVVDNQPFVWGSELLRTAMKTLFGREAIIHHYQSKRDL